MTEEKSSRTEFLTPMFHKIVIYSYNELELYCLFYGVHRDIFSGIVYFVGLKYNSVDHIT